MVLASSEPCTGDQSPHPFLRCAFRAIEHRVHDCVRAILSRHLSMGFPFPAPSYAALFWCVLDPVLFSLPNGDACGTLCVGFRPSSWFQYLGPSPSHGLLEMGIFGGSGRISMLRTIFRTLSCPLWRKVSSTSSSSFPSSMVRLKSSSTISSGTPSSPWTCLTFHASTCIAISWSVSPFSTFPAIPPTPGGPPVPSPPLPQCLRWSLPTSTPGPSLRTM